MKIPDYNKKIKHPTYLELQEEIKRLKEEYIMLQNASDEVEEEKDKEIERLNNIINELENILKDLIFGSNNLNHKLTAQIILMRLKELKGSDKE